MKKNNNKYFKLISQIENIRKKNNGNWMDLLRLAFELSPKRASKILTQILNHDDKISNLARKLEKLSK